MAGQAPPDVRLRAGRVADAGVLIGIQDARSPDLGRWPVELVRAAVDARSGRLGDAAERVDRLLPEVLVDDEADFDVLCVAADIDFWCGTIGKTLPRLLRDLTDGVDTSPVRIVLPALVLAARGAAEDALDRPSSGAASTSTRDLVTRVSLHLRPAENRDPLVRAHIGTARTELARAVRADRVAAWTDAATLWDTLGRPHDSACCRWRGAVAAHRAHQPTVAARLLTRAAADAREHVPLRDAIAATAAS